MGDHYGGGEGPSEDELLDTLADAVQTLDAAGIPYLLMGGIGSFALGRPRSTDDIDLFLRPEDAKEALKALGDAGFETEETFPDWLFKAFKRGALVDLIFRSSGDVFLDDEMRQRSRDVEFKDLKIPVVSPEDLLVIKAVATKENSSHHWYDALAIIARCDLDWEYLLTRARQAGPRRVLSLLLYAESTDLAVPADVVDALFAAVRPTGLSGARHEHEPDR